MASAIVVELPSSDEEEEKVPEVKPKASKGIPMCFFFKFLSWATQKHNDQTSSKEDLKLAFEIFLNKNTNKPSSF